MRLADLVGKPTATDTVLLAVRIPRSVDGALRKLRKALGSTKSTMVVALLNEGLAAYDALAGPKRGRKPAAATPVKRRRKRRKAVAGKSAA